MILIEIESHQFLASCPSQPSGYPPMNPTHASLFKLIASFPLVDTVLWGGGVRGVYVCVYLYLYMNIFEKQEVFQVSGLQPS